MCRHKDNVFERLQVKKICADYLDRFKAINNHAWEDFKNALNEDLGNLSSYTRSV